MLDQGLRARHVLVGAVGAGADEAGGEGFGPVVGADAGRELGDGHGEVGGEGAVDVGFEVREVDGYEVVVDGVRVCLQVVGGCEGLDGGGERAAVRRLQVGDVGLRCEGE